MSDVGLASIPGQLLVWTDVDPAFDADFNSWYDREHMAERVGIPGFVWARRYRAVSSRRPYLALYRTQTLPVFRSAAYQQAFQHQTSWSLTNFARMRDTVRRVGTVDAEVGEGTGGALGLVRMPASADNRRLGAAKLKDVLAIDGVLSGHVFMPDAALSTPLTADAAAAAQPNDCFAFVEATSEPAAAAAIRTISDALDPSGLELATFTLLWELRAKA